MIESSTRTHINQRYVEKVWDLSVVLKLKDEDNDVEIEFKSTQLFTTKIHLTESVSRDLLRIAVQ